MPRFLVSSLCGLALLASACSPSDVRRFDETTAPLAPLPPVPVVIWSSRDLPLGLDALVAKIDGVRWVNPESVGMVNLLAVTDAKSLPKRTPGTIFPLSVGAIDPTPDSDDTVSRTLAAGQAVMTETAAALRGITAGSTVTVQAGPVKRTFRIGAVVPDAEGRQRELVVSRAHAAALRLSPPRTLITSVLAERLTEVVGEMQSLTQGVPARIESGLSQQEDPGGSEILSFANVKRIFGEVTYRPDHGTFVALDPAWVDRNIVKVTVPLLGLIPCNRRLLPQLNGAMKELIARGLGGLVRTSDGCYSPRHQFENPYALSRHAFGIAVDINAGTNRFGDPPRQDPRLVAVMEKWGFTWGGRWLIPDGMHFEFVRFP